MGTRATADAVLRGRVGRQYTLAGVTVSPASPVPEFSDALAWALEAVGAPAADPDDPLAPTDADLARVPADRWRRFLDYAELRLIDVAVSVVTGSAASSVAFEDFKESTSSSAGTTLAAYLARKTAEYYDLWGPPETATGGLTTGRITVRTRPRRPEF